MFGFAVYVRSDRVFQQPLYSAGEVSALKEKLMGGDKKIERNPFYFPQAMKAEKAFFKMIKGLILDLITLPYRMYTFGTYKKELKKNLPIYQYLQQQQVPQKYLDADRFELFFLSGEQSAAPFVKEGGVLRAIIGDEKFDPNAFKGRNYQQYERYFVHVYNGVGSRNGGLRLLDDETKAEIRQRFIAS